MRKINALFVGLTLSLAILSGIAFEQITKANLPAPGLECEDLTNCTSGASCGGKGSATGCWILCENGASIRCPVL
jgi:hypothetical protein